MLVEKIYDRKILKAIYWTRDSKYKVSWIAAQFMPGSRDMVILTKKIKNK